MNALLKSKREENNNTTPVQEEQQHGSGRTRDIGVQKEYEIVTEISHASIQTTPTLTNSIRVGGSGPAFVDTTEKGVQRQVKMTETSCQQEKILTLSSATSTEQLKTADFGTCPDREIALSAMKSFATSTEQLKTADSGTGPDREIALSTMKSFATSTEKLKTADFGTGPDKEIALSAMKSFATSTEKLVTTDSKTGPDNGLFKQSSVSCQKSLVSASNIHHTTQTDPKSLNSASTMAGCPAQSYNEQGVGRDFELRFDETGVQTIRNEHATSASQTLEKVVHSASTMAGCATLNHNNKSVGRDTELLFNEEGVQTVSLELNTTSSQTLPKTLDSVSTMIGCPARSLVDASIGHDIIYNDNDTQTTRITLNTIHSQTDPRSVSSAGIQAKPIQLDFSCGDGIANLGLTDQSIGCTLLTKPHCHVSTATERLEIRDYGVQISPAQVTSVATGDGDINEPIWCDRCSARTTTDIAIGTHDDSGDRTADACIGCETAKTHSVAIGDFDVTLDPTKCDECEKRKRDSSYFNFDFNMGSVTGTSCSNCNGCQQQQPIICHYCGNKVDLNDDAIDETLQAMRDSMQSLSGRSVAGASGKQISELKRSGARKNLNLDLNDDDAR